MAHRGGAIFTDISMFCALASRKHSSESPASSFSSDGAQMIKRMDSDGSVGRKSSGGLDLFGWHTHRSGSCGDFDGGSTHLAPLKGCACFDEERLGASAPEFDQVVSSAPLYDDEYMAPSAPELTPTSFFQSFSLERMPSAPSFEDEDLDMEEEEIGVFRMDDVDWEQDTTEILDCVM